MAELFLPHGFSYSAEDVAKYVVEPLPGQPGPVRTVRDRDWHQVQQEAGQILSALEKITKVYAKARPSTPEGGVTYTQRELAVAAI